MGDVLLQTWNSTNNDFFLYVGVIYSGKYRFVMLLW
jgi:hypothetical protein